MTAETFDYTLARQLLDDGHGITREAWEGKNYVYKRNEKYYSVLVTQEYNRFELQQSLVADLDRYLEAVAKEQGEGGVIIETPIADYQIYPPAPAYGFKE